MKAIIGVLVVGIFLAGCAPSQQEVTYAAWPKDLIDCKVYEISNGVGGITIVRCPNSTVSTAHSQGKTTVTTVVIDGVEYEKKDR